MGDLDTLVASDWGTTIPWACGLLSILEKGEREWKRNTCLLTSLASKGHSLLARQTDGESLSQGLVYLLGKEAGKGGPCLDRHFPDGAPCCEGEGRNLGGYWLSLL